jgi:CTP synthase
MPDVIGEGTQNSLYLIPLNLEKEKIGEKIMKILNMEKKKEIDLSKWKEAVDKMIYAKNEIIIGVVGKYLSIGDYKLTDSYLSVHEALKHAAAKNNIKLSIKWIDSADLETKNPEAVLKEVKGILIPGGFGAKGVEGKIKAIKYARENNLPFLGLCFGLQLAVIEFARNVCNLEANSTEIDQNAKDKVIDILPEQKSITSKGATMRLGSYKAVLKEGTKTKEMYNSTEVNERHRHRYEVNPLYHQILQENGLVFSGVSEDKKLVEFIELPKKKFFIATQAHPEFKSSLLHPSPIFEGFIKSCIT